MALARAAAISRERGDQTHQRHATGVREQRSQLRNTPGILGAVLAVEAEIAANAVAEVVAIETVRPATGRDQPLLGRRCDRRLAGTGQAGEPQRGAMLPELPPACCAVEIALLPEHRLAGVAVARVEDEARHQKYPAFLRSSIAASEVLSSALVWPRSVTRVVSISLITSATVVAIERTAPVHAMSPTVR